MRSRVGTSALENQTRLLLPCLWIKLLNKIKKLKGIGGITGLTQHDEILDRFLLTAPELSRFVEDFQERYTRVGGCTEPSKEHYQL